MPEDILTPIVTGLIVGIILKVYDYVQVQRHKEIEKKEQLKAEESFLRTDLLWAIAKLSYATAMAIKRGKPNGEIEEGVALYDSAKDKYNNFLNRNNAKWRIK